MNPDQMQLNEEDMLLIELIQFFKNCPQTEGDAEKMISELQMKNHLTSAQVSILYAVSRTGRK